MCRKPIAAACVGTLLFVGSAVAFAGSATATPSPEPHPTPTPAAPPIRVDLGATNQYYVHGVLPELGQTFSSGFVQGTGGQEAHRIGWRSNSGYLVAPVDSDARFVFTHEANEIAQRIQAEYEKDHRPVFLHGHSAGGVMAAEVSRILTNRSIPVAGMATYGTPEQSLRFHDVPLPDGIPVAAFENSPDLVLKVDKAFAGGSLSLTTTHPKAQVIRFDSGDVEGHTMAKHEPAVGPGLERLRSGLPVFTNQSLEGDCEGKSCSLSEQDDDAAYEKYLQSEQGNVDALATMTADYLAAKNPRSATIRTRPPDGDSDGDDAKRPERRDALRDAARAEQEIEGGAPSSGPDHAADDASDFAGAFEEKAGRGVEDYARRTESLNQAAHSLDEAFEERRRGLQDSLRVAESPLPDPLVSNDRGSSDPGSGREHENPSRADGESDCTCTEWGVSYSDASNRPAPRIWKPYCKTGVGRSPTGETVEVTHDDALECTNPPSGPTDAGEPVATPDLP